jgi:hypothetical protein
VLPVAPAPIDRNRTVRTSGWPDPPPAGRAIPGRVTAGSRTQVFAAAGRRTDRCATATWRVDRTGLERVISRLRAWRAGRCSNGPRSARPRPGFRAACRSGICQQCRACGERPSGARESNAVSPAPKAGGLPSPSPQPRPARLRRRDGSRCPLWSCQRTAPDAWIGIGRGGRTRTHYLRFWRPACKPGAPHPWDICERLRRDHAAREAALKRENVARKEKPPGPRSRRAAANRNAGCVRYARHRPWPNQPRQTYRRWAAASRAASPR